MFINNISASRSDIIDQCLLKYQRRYVLRLPGYGNKNEESLNFGSFIHKIFEIGYQSTSSKELIKLAESNRETYKIGTKFIDKTKICIENFVQWNSQLGETISTEMKYEVDLDKKNDIKHIGVIDRVVKGNQGGFLVIDYKTSKREKKRHDLISDNQLMGYAYAISTLYGVKLSEVYCTHYYPVTGHCVPPVRFNQSQINAWKKKAINKVWNIRKRKKDDFPPMKNIFCPYCEHEPTCTAFNTPEVVEKNLQEQICLRDKLKAEKARLDEKTKPS